jgi:hypothetical protein
MAKKQAQKKIVLSTNHNGNYDYSSDECDEIVAIIKKFTESEGVRSWNVQNAVILNDVDFKNKEVAMQWLVRADGHFKDVYTERGVYYYVTNIVKEYFRVRYPKDNKVQTPEDFLKTTEKSVDGCVSAFINLLVLNYSFRSGKDANEIRLDLIDMGVEDRVFEKIMGALKVEVEKFF